MGSGSVLGPVPVKANSLISELMNMLMNNFFLEIHKVQSQTPLVFPIAKSLY